MDTLKRIKELSAERDWTEYRLAKQANLSQSTVANIFHRNNVPTVTTIESICKAFGITLSQFFADGNDMVSLADEEKELLKYWSHLSLEQKQGFLQIMKNT